MPPTSGYETDTYVIQIQSYGTATYNAVHFNSGISFAVLSRAIYLLLFLSSIFSLPYFPLADPNYNAAAFKGVSLCRSEYPNNNYKVYYYADAANKSIPGVSSEVIKVKRRGEERRGEERDERDGRAGKERIVLIIIRVQTRLL